MKPVRLVMMSATGGRAGATLTEILMAILIMAVGVVSVFTLFPISVMRSIQATQQTNSKILKLNAAELIETNPRFLLEFAATSAPLNGVAFPLNKHEWSPNWGYSTNQIVVPTLKPGSSQPRPLTWFVAMGNGTSAATEPIWNADSDTTDNDITWRPLPLRFNISKSYVVDPLGWTSQGEEGNTTIQDVFGNKTDQTTGTPSATNGITRIHGGLNNFPLALNNVTQPDSWEAVFTATPTAATTTATDSTVTFASSIDLAGVLPTPLPTPSPRVSLTSTDGSKTLIRYPLSVAGQTVTFTKNLNSFPQVAGIPDIGTARVEVLNRRYTWFLTIRNGSNSAPPEISCVVVFNRNLSSASEHAYDSNFGNENLDIDNDGTNDGAQHGLTGRSDWVKVIWNPTGAGPGTLNEPEPLLKPGNFIFDASNAAWYRIQQIRDRDNAAGFEHAILIVERTVRDITPAGTTGRTILMPGVVEVFPL